MQIRFDGKTIAVTGAGHGFGRAIARRFAALGGHVFATDINALPLMETSAAGGISNRCRRSARPRGGGGLGRRHRARDRRRDRRAGQQRRRRRGPDQPPDRGGAGRRLGRHLRHRCQRGLRVVPGRRARHETGRLGSHRQHQLWRRVAGVADRNSGILFRKHAVVGLTRQLAHELGPFGITVNSVAPGFIRTNEATERQWDSYGPDGQRALVDRIAMKRLGSAEDIANAVVFFASDLAGFVNGQILRWMAGGSARLSSTQGSRSAARRDQPAAISYSGIDQESHAMTAFRGASPARAGAKAQRPSWPRGSGRIPIAPRLSGSGGFATDSHNAMEIGYRRPNHLTGRIRSKGRGQNRSQRV